MYLQKRDHIFENQLK